MLAQAYRRNGRFDRAEEAARRAVDPDLTDGEGTSSSATLLRAGRSEEFVASWSRVVAPVPDHGPHRQGLVQRTPERVAEDLLRLPASDPIRPTATAYFGLGTVISPGRRASPALDGASRCSRATREHGQPR
jgi:hypothetical protein